MCIGWMGQIPYVQTTINLPSSISGIMEFQRFTDSGNSETYSVLIEAEDADNDGCMFFGITQEMMDYYSSTVWHQILYHGMGTDSCGNTDVFMSHGEHQLIPPQGDIVYTFQNNVLAYNPTWNVEVDGETSCNLDGGSNTSGRLINGVPASQVCDRAVSNYGETCIHIEQKIESRTASDWIDAVNDIFTSGVAPDSPSDLIASTYACDQMDLYWQDNSDNETQFRIERSENGSDYTEIDSVGAEITSYSDTTVTEDTTY